MNNQEYDAQSAEAGLGLRARGIRSKHRWLVLQICLDQGLSVQPLCKGLTLHNHEMTATVLNMLHLKLLNCRERFQDKVSSGTRSSIGYVTLKPHGQCQTRFLQSSRQRRCLVALQSQNQRVKDRILFHNLQVARCQASPFPKSGTPKPIQWYIILSLN